MTTGCITIETTFAKREDAAEMRLNLVRKRLVAAAKVEEVDSTYRWNGEVVDTTEYVLKAQTTAEKYQDVEDYIALHHDYDLPCIIKYDIEGGKPEFLRWIKDCVAEEPKLALARVLEESMPTFASEQLKLIA